MSEKYSINYDCVLPDGRTLGEALAGPRYPFDPDKCDWYVAPGETLEDLMEERRLTVPETAARCNLPPATIQGVLTAKIAITEEIAAGLEKGTGISSQGWLTMEQDYQRQKARLDQKQQAQRSRALRSAAAL